MTKRERYKPLAEKVFDISYLIDQFNARVLSTAANHPEYVIRDPGRVARYGSDLRASLLRAERFYLDDDFVQRATRLCWEPVAEQDQVLFDPKSSRALRVSTKAKYEVNPDLLHKAVRLARSPFPTVWLEWDARTMFRERLALGSMKDIASDSPLRMGALLSAADEDGSLWDITCFPEPPPDKNWTLVYAIGAAAQKQLHGMPWPSIIRSRISTELKFDGSTTLYRDPDGIRLDIDSLTKRLDTLIGTYRVEINCEAEQDVNDLTDYAEGKQPYPKHTIKPEARYLNHPILHHVQLYPDEWAFAAAFGSAIREVKYPGSDLTHSIPSLLQEIIDNEVGEGRGFLRFVVNALALINISVIEYEQVSAPPGRRIIHGKSRPYLTHRTVRINVPSGVRHVTQYLHRQLIEQHRRAHNVRGHWRRAHLRKGKDIPRSWIPAHVRGDSSLGFVRQSHVVTAKEDLPP